MRVWSFSGGNWASGDAEGDVLRWFDIDGPPDRADFEAIAERYGLHPLAVEDCLSLNSHAPKIEDFGDHLFIVIHGFELGPDGPEPVEFDVFLGTDFLVTYSDVPVSVCAEVERALGSGQSVRPGTDGLFYEIFDRVVDDLVPLADTLSAKLEGVQAEALETGNVSPATNHHVLEIRARAGRLRRLLITQTLIAQRLGRGELPCIHDENRP
ncbi:MAG: CorA family divalent cation transporter, partial [Dehalococcoidia bacterium]